MSNKLTPEKLKEEESFQLIKELAHNEVVDFVMREIKQLRWPMILFYGINIVLLVMVLSVTLLNIADRYIAWSQYGLSLVIGIFLGMIPVIPLHELLHGLAYKIAGAPKVVYGADLRQMLFYASAPSFVIGKNSFLMVAFLPFLIINSVFVLFFICAEPSIQLAALFALLTHSTLCIGDFAMANFFAAYPGQTLYTYDDSKASVSYFYKEITHSS